MDEEYKANLKKERDFFINLKQNYRCQLEHVTRKIEDIDEKLKNEQQTTGRNK